MSNAPIRTATPADIPALIGLMQEFYAEAGLTLAADPAARTFAALLKDTRLGQVWMMEVDDQPAGFVVLAVSFSMEYGGLRGFVDDFFVARRFRQRGIGTAALAAVVRFCNARDVRALLVETGPDNEPALRAYRRHGFVETGRVFLKLELASQVHLT